MYDLIRGEGEAPIRWAHKPEDVNKAFEGPWTSTAYVKERCILHFPGVELHLMTDGTYFLADSSGG